MTEDFAQATDWRALPKGMPAMAALVATGNSYVTYKPQRDGLPEVVVRAYARVGPEGLAAIAHLAYSMKPTPTLEDAAALCEWGIEHYVGREIARKDDDWPQAEWAARGRLVRAYTMRTWGKEIAKIEGAPEDWADRLDWVLSAELDELGGRFTFAEHKDQDSGQTEVYMFDGRWAPYGP